MSEDPLFRAAAPADLETLVAIRIAAMRPSLEALGRFDPERARRRLVDSFRPEDTYIVECGGVPAGFYALDCRSDPLRLDHLYLMPEYQGRGLGGAVLDRVKAQARHLGRAVVLQALRQSPANAFYGSRGFRQTGTDEFDNGWRWEPGWPDAAAVTVERNGPVGAAELNKLFATNGWQVDGLEKLEASLAGSWCRISARAADGALVGFVQAISDGIRHAYILKMIVHPDFRRQGIGGRIMEELMAALGEHGMLPTLVATPGNEGFYARFGFRSECKGLKAMCIR
jgi:GNAT superfamily N-acetyltransferase